MRRRRSGAPSARRGARRWQRPRGGSWRRSSWHCDNGPRGIPWYRVVPRGIAWYRAWYNTTDRYLIPRVVFGVVWRGIRCCPDCTQSIVFRLGGGGLEALSPYIDCKTPLGQDEITLLNGWYWIPCTNRQIPLRGIMIIATLLARVAGGITGYHLSPATPRGGTLCLLLQLLQAALRRLSQ